MSRTAFQRGLSIYKEGRYQDALQHFTEVRYTGHIKERHIEICLQALDHDGPNKYLILDTRSSTYLKLGETKKALRDAKKTIEVAPERWQGYARAARVFFQIKKFDASLTMVDMALAKLKEEDAKRRESLVSLKVEVEAAQRVFEAGFVDHMGKLPIEIFSEIANMVIAEDQTSLIVLSHVSKHWRAVIHGLPRLWDTLLLTKRRPVQKTRLWIDKSRGKIKELSIRSSVLDVPWSGNYLDRLQWENLRVLKVQGWDDIIGLRLLGNLSSLLNVEHFETDGVREINSCPFLIQDRAEDNASSNLRYLSITLESLGTISGPLRVQCLTSLKLANVLFFHDFVDFLESNPNLEHLFLHTVNSKPSNRKAVLHKLKTLSLTLVVPNSIGCVEMPALEVLRFDALPMVHRLLPICQSLVDKDSNHLTELIIRSTSLPQDAVIPLLRISNALQTLQISNVCSLAPPVIEALATPATPAHDPSIPDSSASPVMLCPHLTSVDFSSCPDVETGPLVRLVKSRLPKDDPTSENKETRAPSPINSLVVDFCPRIDSMWLQWFRTRVPQVSCVYMKKNTKYRAS